MIRFSRSRRFPSRSRRTTLRRSPIQLEPLEQRTVLSTFTVTNLSDSGDGSLRQAIIDANERPGEDSIRFSHDVQGTIELSDQLVITDDLTIRGPGADDLTVSGGDTTRVFAVVPADLADSLFVTPTSAQVATSPEVTIEKLAIENGLATDALGFDPAAGFAFGGGLYNLGGTVHLDRVDMAGNATSGGLGAGGAVANEFGGTLTVSRSEFQDNTSEAILVAVGGAITSDLGPTADGGATGQPTVTIERSTFTGNTARALGGYTDGVPFSGVAGGGAILNLTGTMTIDRSHFEANAAEGGAGSAGNTSGGAGFGGAVLTGDVSPFGIADSRLEVSRSTFVGNTATGGDGGAAGLPGGVGSGGAVAVSNGSDAEFSRNTFRGNAAVGGSGGADATGGLAWGGGVSGFGGSTLTLERNEFIENTVEGGPGANGRGGGLACTPSH